MFRIQWFFLIVVITILFLFTVNYPVVPARASSLRVDVPGEQEKIKSTVQSYFEIRYHAFNTLQLDVFGDLISDYPEAESFLSLERGKLEVQIKHAELNQLRYSQYQFFLDFKDIAIDMDNLTATVSVIEGHDVVFEISQEVSPIETYCLIHAKS